MTIAIASDHAGVALKNALIKHLIAQNRQVLDLGTDDESSVDYPDFAAKVAEKILAHHVSWGILICGSGIGISMAANRYPGIRAALVTDAEHVKLSRAHNDANVLCLGARFVAEDTAIAWTDLFLATPFEGERHTRRVEKLG